MVAVIVSVAISMTLVVPLAIKVTMAVARIVAVAMAGALEKTVAMVKAPRRFLQQKNMFMRQQGFWLLLLLLTATPSPSSPEEGPQCLQSNGGPYQG